MHPTWMHVDPTSFMLWELWRLHLYVHDLRIVESPPSLYTCSENYGDLPLRSVEPLYRFCTCYKYWAALATSTCCEHHMEPCFSICTQCCLCLCTHGTHYTCMLQSRRLCSSSIVAVRHTQVSTITIMYWGSMYAGAYKMRGCLREVLEFLECRDA